ncbi:hypothetical protein G5B39_08605 [Rhodobacteraceae bacterium SC52]|nr:hypothetical protein G5B39_08605 [Rhodobacteraceae bacterium SC52]
MRAVCMRPAQLPRPAGRWRICARAMAMTRYRRSMPNWPTVFMMSGRKRRWALSLQRSLSVARPCTAPQRSPKAMHLESGEPRRAISIYKPMRRSACEWIWGCAARDCATNGSRSAASRIADHG